MKKTLFSIATLGLVTFSAIRGDAQNLYIGARIGANLANQKTDQFGAFAPSYDAQDITNGMHTGFLAGLQMDRYFSDTWGISAELFYDQKGSHVNFHSAGTIVQPQNLAGPFSETGTSDMTLNYLECSMLLKARFGSGDIQPYVFAGPSAGLFLSSKQHDNITYFESGQYSTFDTTQSIPIAGPGLPLKKFDISIVGGAGVDYKLGSGQMLFLDAAYTYGVTTIAQSSDNMIWARSTDIRLAAGILFPLD